jgi:hypothetical protein
MINKICVKDFSECSSIHCSVRTVGCSLRIIEKSLEGKDIAIVTLVESLCMRSGDITRGKKLRIPTKLRHIDSRGVIFEDRCAAIVVKKSSEFKLWKLPQETGRICSSSWGRREGGAAFTELMKMIQILVMRSDKSFEMLDIEVFENEISQGEHVGAQGNTTLFGVQAILKIQFLRTKDLSEGDAVRITDVDMWRYWLLRTIEEGRDPNTRNMIPLLS